MKNRTNRNEFGLCPVCNDDPVMLNVGREHFAVCHEHKIYWHVGSNLFSGWRDEEPEVWERNKKLLAGYVKSNERHKVGTDSQIDNMAMQDELGRMFAEQAKAEKAKPKVRISTVTKRPTIGTLGDVLKATANLEPMGCTLITGYSESRWNGLRPGECEQLDLLFQGATACLEPTNAVTVYIAEGTTPAIARALLKAIAKEIKGCGDFEKLTPCTPTVDDADSVPFQGLTMKKINPHSEETRSGQGNGPDAANARPAKTHTKHTHILGSSPSIVNDVDLERKAIDAGNDLNFPTGTRHSKTIATQIAELAMAGHAVHKGKCGDYLVSKYGLSHWCSDFAELQLFARKLGVSHA